MGINSLICSLNNRNSYFFLFYNAVIAVKTTFKLSGKADSLKVQIFKN